MELWNMYELVACDLMETILGWLTQSKAAAKPRNCVWTCDESGELPRRIRFLMFQQPEKSQNH